MIPKEQQVDIFDQFKKNKDSKNTYSNRIIVPPITSNDVIMHMMDELNNEQRRIVMHVLNSFKIQKIPLRIFISGSVGVGKCMVINTIYQLL